MASLLSLPEPATVPTLLAARTSIDRALLVCDDEVLTYAAAEQRSAAVAKGLIAAGAGPGTHVGLLHPNGADFVVSWLAAARIGATTVPISTFSTAPELVGLLRSARVRILLAAPSHRGRDLRSLVDQIRPDCPALQRVVFGLDGLEAGGADSDDAVVDALGAAVTPADRMVVVHTSGSTSAPKGVIHPHGTLLRHVAVLNELRAYTPDEVLFSNSPFFWIGGFAYSLLGTLVAGATLVCSNATAAGATLDLLERTRPTMVNGFAAAVAHLADDPTFPDRDLSSIRRGNLWPIMPPRARADDPELRHNMLGMTEAGSVCLASADEGDQAERRRGSFGQPVPGIDARVVDPDTGDERPVGEQGELWLRGPAIMEGYLGRERHDTFTPDGWYRTGDVFHIDDDGFFYFHGRRGEMIKSAGANVAPREVEAVIADVTGLAAHVLGVDDEVRGQIVAAAVRVPTGTPAPDVDELRSALRERLSAYKVPRRYLFLADDDVPMLSSGKLDTVSLRERFDD